MVFWKLALFDRLEFSTGKRSVVPADLTEALPMPLEPADNTFSFLATKA